MNWITKNICEFLTEMAQNFIDFVSDGINALFELAVNACNTSEISGAVGVTSGVAVTLVIAMVLKQILTVYVLETDGDPDSDPLQLLVKAAEAIALISCNGMIFDLLLRMSTALTADIVGSVNLTGVTGVIRNAIGSMTTGNVILPLFMIFIIICVIILGIKAGIRGVELSLMKIAFPFFCVDLIGTGRERWNNFFASYLVTFFGYTLQVFCVRVFITAFSGGETLASYAVAMGWLYMAIKVPEWLQKYVYSTGIGRGIGGGVRMLPFAVMQMKR